MLVHRQRRRTGSGLTTPSNPGFGASWVLPVLIAAVDPTAEARLDGLNLAVTSGKYLTESARDTQGNDIATFPVLAAARTDTGEVAQTQLQLLTPPPSPPAMTASWVGREAAVPGQTVVTVQSTAQQAYNKLLTELRKTQIYTPVSGYWSVGPTSYNRTSSGTLSPVLVHNPGSAYYAGAVSPISIDNEDNQYRKITVHAPQENAFTGDIAAPQLVGTFDPAKVTSFDPLSQVPLGAYQPTVVTPASAAAKKALHGGDLLPNQNLGGYVSQPVTWSRRCRHCPRCRTRVTTVTAWTPGTRSVWCGCGWRG